MGYRVKEIKERSGRQGGGGEQSMQENFGFEADVKIYIPQRNPLGMAAADRQPERFAEETEEQLSLWMPSAPKKLPD